MMIDSKEITNLRELEAAQARLRNRIRYKRADIAAGLDSVKAYYDPVNVLKRAVTGAASLVDWKTVALTFISHLRKKL